MTSKLDIVAEGDREIVITRTFDAPPHLVFEAHTVPALMKHWFTGPDGWKLATCEIDLRQGGAYRHVWEHEDGRSMGMGGVYKEVDPPRRLVATEKFDEDWTGGGTVNTQTFEPLGNDRTRLTTTVLCTSSEARDNMLKSNMEAGIAVSYAKLDALLAGAPVGEKA